MRWLRALAFNIAFFAVTALLGMAGLPLLLAPRRRVMQFGRLWARSVLWLLRAIVGLDGEIRGLDKLPAGSLHRRDEAPIRLGHADPAGRARRSGDGA